MSAHPQSVVESLWPIAGDGSPGVYTRLAEKTRTRLATLGIEILGFSHVGIAVPDVKRSAAKLAEVENPEWGKLKIEWGTAFGCHVIRRWVSGMEIEIIQPVSPSHLRTFLETTGGGVHHMSFEIGDINAVVRALQAAGGEMAHPAIMNGLHGRIAFFTATDVCPVSLELCQPLH